MNKKSLVIGFISLFVLSALAPMSLGCDVKTTYKESDDNEYLEYLYFLCRTPDGFNEEKYQCYRKQILKHDLNGDLVEDYETGTIDRITHSFPSPLIQSNGPMDSAWPMKCHDNRHTSQSPYNTADNPGFEKWRFKTRKQIEGGPVISDDGTIYFGELGTHIYAIYPNGTLKWKYEIGQWIWSTPAIAEDGTIYVGSYDAKLYAINPDGTKKWRIATSGSISSSPAIAEDGTVYFGVMGPGNSGRIYAINPNGTQKWSYDTGYWIVSDPAIGDDGTIYIGSGDTYLYALNPDGTLKWRFKTGDIIKAHPSIGVDGIVYISAFDHYLYAIYSNNGTLKWKRGSDNSGCSSVAIRDDGILYFGSLYAAYPNNGTTKWHINLPDIDHSSLAISSDGTIYTGAGKYIYAVNPDGTEKWRKNIATNWVDSSPCVAKDGTVYIGSSSDEGGMPYGYLHAFGPQESNDPPETPNIEGPASGKIDTKYTFKLLSTDPDRNPISYYVNWGDGTNSGWTEDVNTGEDVTLSHTWKNVNTFTIKAKVKDTFGLESNETEFEIKISNPRARTLLRFIDMFPILQRMLSLLI